jgi:prepilin-type processing-associated H-X9-DG protein
MKSISRRFNQSAFTLVALFVIVAVLAILAALLLPALVMSKKKSSKLSCVNSLKQCGLAFRMWEGDNGDKYPMDVPMANGGTKEFDTGANTFRHFQVISNELSTPRILVCPNDDRISAVNFVQLKNTNVSYFVGLEANDANPQRFLNGDRNLTSDNAPENGILKLVPDGPVSWTTAIHNNHGNVGLADGSVQQYSSSALRQALKSSGDPTNTWRIALPE